MTQQLTVRLLTCLAITLGSGASEAPKRSQCADPRLDKSHPSTYVDFVKSGQRKPFHVDESEDGIWLRLHNNTVWDLVLPMFGVPEDLGDAGVYYEVVATPGEAVRDLPVGERLRDLVSLDTVKPGRGVVFSIPREHLERGLAIRIEFQYGWETSHPPGILTDMPTHYVTYTSRTLNRQEKEGGTRSREKR